jgi:hypothetical protein
MDTIGLIVGIVGVIVAGVPGYFYLASVIEQARKDFRVNQPNLRIINLSGVRTGDVITLLPDVENIGQGIGYECTVTLDGWKGLLSLGKIFPRGPRFQVHRLSIVLGTDAPIRSVLVSNPCIRLRYHDRWGQLYEVWYHVRQVRELDKSAYGVEVDLEHPGMLEPNPSFLEIRKFLRNISLYD